MDPKSSPPLRKVKRFYFDYQGNTLVPSAPSGPRKLKPLLRIDFKSPKEDYIFVQEIRPEQGTLVCRRKNRFHIAVIRESYSPTPLHTLEVLAQVQHPNIADILDVYFHDNQLFIVSEHLDVSLLDLEFSKLAPEEWEIATIAAEIIKAMTYLLDTLPTCELYIDSVRLSLEGDVKLVPDIHYQRSREEYVADHQYNSAFLAGILDVLMSHGTTNDQGWSREALEFSSSIPVSHSVAPVMNHVFLSKAVSSSRLVPRIRLATQMLSWQSRVSAREHNLASPAP